MELFSKASDALSKSKPIAQRGVVTEITGLIIEGSGPAVGVGATCMIEASGGKVPAQVVGFKKGKVQLMALGETYGIAPGAGIVSYGERASFEVNDLVLSRVIDPMGQPIDGGPGFGEGTEVEIFASPPSPLDRERIREPFDVGIRSVNTLLTTGRGQRVAVMAGSGVGKSTFLGMVARHSSSDVNVIALVGERGREVREFIEKDLGPEGLRRTVLVVATSDTSALLRIRAAFVATAIAEYFRDRGAQVTLLLDSLTRFCMAQREIGLAIGEPPSSSGYTPSVFALLPKLLERAGTVRGKGAITAFYTVLVEGDDIHDPIADAVRGILDGHIVLSRDLASRGHYPAIDVIQSLSRVMPDIVSPERMSRAHDARRVLADFAEAEDLITIGAYKAGQNPKVDYAVQHIDALKQFLMQKPDEGCTIDDSNAMLDGIFAGSEAQQRLAGAGVNVAPISDAMKSNAA